LALAVLRPVPGIHGPSADPGSGGNPYRFKLHVGQAGKVFVRLRDEEEWHVRRSSAADAGLAISVDTVAVAEATAQAVILRQGPGTLCW
jgi:hypothetical protein